MTEKNSKPLWAKPGVVINPRIMKFLAGEDLQLDRQLMPFDIVASRAHAQGLGNAGVLSKDEVAKLVEALDQLAAEVSSGAFELDESHEDGHSAIEFWLTQKLGDLGKKIHTGRSRNDQVLVATRLWLKSKLVELQTLNAEIATVCLERAEVEKNVAMPGYTHLQRAVVSSVGMWWAGFAEAFIDDAVLAKQSLQWLDANPLGTAAGYGVNIKLDREHTTQVLGFSRMQINPIYAQISRGKFELQALAALSQSMLDVRRLAWDLSLFTTTEYGFVNLPAEYTTGSSIMPNKRNPDVVELLRASFAVVQGAMAELMSLQSLPSGYQRDLQYTKAPTLRALQHGLEALNLLPDLLRNLTWEQDRLNAAIEPSMYCTDLAIENALAGIPFRDAYAAAASPESVASLAQRKPENSLDARVSPGACADLRLDELQQRLLSVGN